MKKILLIVLIVVFTVSSVGGGIYWYRQLNRTIQADSLQTIALDNSDIETFSDVCTAADNGYMICQGNIEKFGCARYADMGSFFAHLLPTYSISRCEKDMSFQDAQSSTEGIYRRFHPVGWGAGGATIINYIVIKDAKFQLIKSDKQLRDLYQPIDSIIEAEEFFKAHGKGSLIQKQDLLNSIKQKMETSGKLYVSSDTLTLSTVDKTVGGFVVTAYSDATLECVEEFYSYTFFLATDGSITEQSEQLIWESDIKPVCLE